MINTIDHIGSFSLVSQIYSLTFFYFVLFIYYLFFKQLLQNFLDADFNMDLVLVQTLKPYVKFERTLHFIYQ
jgi:hypothetical protein